MARETKVGLLVGLGFIICFAIILENRGRREPVVPKPTEATIASAAETDNGAKAIQAEQSARRFRPQARSTRPPGSKPAAQRGQRRSVANPPRPSGQTSALSSPGASDDNQATPRRGAVGRGPARTGRSGPVVNPESSTSPATSPPSAAPAVASRAPTSGTEEAEATLAAVNQQPIPTPSASEPAARNGRSATTSPTANQLAPIRRTQARLPDTPVVASRQYKVVQGDSLTKIARRHYGSGAQNVIDAIYDANRATLANPNSLKVGQTLVLPMPGGTRGGEADSGTAAARVTEPAGAERSKTTPSAKPEYTYYQVKKGDMLERIAREYLGDAKRWREIAELNRDIFPDPSKIRHGVRIRLPARIERTQP